MRSNRLRLRNNHSALDLLLLDTAKEDADVVAGHSLVQRLVEHLDAGADRLQRVANAHQLDLFALQQATLLGAAGDHRSTTGDREHILDGHEEGLVDLALRLGDVVVHRIHELEDHLALLAVGLTAAALTGLQRRTHDDRDIVAREVVLGQQLAHLELDEFEQLGVVDQVDLVHEHHDGRHTDLTSEKDVLASLGHGAVVRADHQDRPVHLGGAGNHVLDVVSVPRAVHVGIVPLFRRILDVSGSDGDPALTLLRSLVDRIELAEHRQTLLREDHGDRRGKSRLTVVDVSDGAHIHVGLVPYEGLLGHHSLLFNTLTATLAALDIPKKPDEQPVELLVGFEPTTSSLPRMCSTPEPQQPWTPLFRSPTLPVPPAMERAEGIEPS